jgi:hypothetical protein
MLCCPNVVDQSQLTRTAAHEKIAVHALFALDLVSSPFDDVVLEDLMNLSEGLLFSVERT